MQLLATVQAGTLSDGQRNQLDARVPDVVQQHLNTMAAPEGVVWTEIPSTYGYTAGKPSRSSLVRVEVPDTIDQPSREALMHAVCQVWMDVTGCTIDEIVVTAVNEVSTRATP